MWSGCVCPGTSGIQCYETRRQDEVFFVKLFSVGICIEGWISKLAGVTLIFFGFPTIFVCDVRLSP